MGFTTIGGWSDFQALKQSRDRAVAFAPVLHIGSTAGRAVVGHVGPEDPRADGPGSRATRFWRCATIRGLIGYYSDNEWLWNAICSR